MTSQEREQLNRLLQQLVSITAIAKDPEASSLIEEKTAANPDATYLLVQRTLLLEQALTQAKAKIQDLENQLVSRGSNSFLNNDPWSQPASAPITQGNPAQRLTPSPVYSNQNNSNSTSFLGNVATTAAGVVAGSFLFQGIEHLLGHSGSGFHSYSDSLMGQPVNESTVINNFYGDDALREASLSSIDEGNNLVSDDNSGLLDESDLDSDWI